MGKFTNILILIAVAVPFRLEAGNGSGIEGPVNPINMIGHGIETDGLGNIFNLPEGIVEIPESTYRRAKARLSYSEWVKLINPDLILFPADGGLVSSDGLLVVPSRVELGLEKQGR